MYLITIDGPSASGKSTVAKIVAEKLNIAHINSGEAYRAIAYFMQSVGIQPNEEERVNEALKNNTFDMLYNDGKQSLLVNGKDVTKHLHTNKVNNVVSTYGKNPQVIYAASDMARKLVNQMSMVMEGRNLGSFCFPEAEYKFYVDCDPEVRAERRYNEMLQKGIEVDFDEIYQQTLERDNYDKTRPVAPLIIPKGAIIIDSSYLTPEQVADEIINVVLINKKQQSQTLNNL